MGGDLAVRDNQMVTVTLAGPRSLALAGAVAGLALVMVPAVMMCLVILANVVRYAAQGERHMGVIGASGVERSLGILGRYFTAGGPYLLALVLLSVAMALCNQVSVRRNKVIGVPTDASQTVHFGWEMPPVVVGLPIAVAILLPDLANILLHGAGALLFVGAGFYALWELAYWPLVDILARVDPRALMDHSIAKVLKEHDWVGSTHIEAHVEDGGVVRLEGHVSQREMVSVARSAVTSVKGVQEVDTSGLLVRPR